MQLRHLKTVLQPPGGEKLTLQKVTAITWAPNNRKLAVCTMDRVVILYDEHGEKRDKFSTKPTDKGPKDYIVRDMAFSSDSTKLAIAQSDNIVFVYKLGVDWGEKKSICNKFPQSSAVTTMVWPNDRPNEVVFGLAEGKVKIGQLKSNKPATLYSTTSYVAALAASGDGNGIVSSHADGAIYRFFFDDNGAGPKHAKLGIHSSVPYALSWGHAICAAGNDGKVVFYDADGGLIRTFDYSNQPDCREFTVAAVNPTGDAIVVGNFNSFYTFVYNARADSWEEAGVRVVENMYTVTALAWKADGSRLAVGALCGVVDLYDACIKRTRYKAKFEFTYVSISQVIVKRLSSGTRIVLKSNFGCEITKINIFQDRYVVANTSETLLLGDLDTFKLSEIPWHGSSGKEKYMFENPHAALVYLAGELSIVEYGRNEILGSIRTDNTSAHLLSVRLNERRARRDDSEAPRDDDPAGDNKKIAYLLDQQTINIKNLVTQARTSVNHDSKIDWLELNGRGNLLLFRDRLRQLHLYNIDTQTRSTLLNFCTYVQWVPESDVVVAQSRNTLCVWYNIHAPDQVTNHTIKGDVYEIERAGGRTEVVVNEGYREASYLLDEALIEFGTAIDDRDYARAMDILEPLEVTPEAEAMWNQLSDMALVHGDITIAERCAAALCDVSRASYLASIRVTAKQAKEIGVDPRDHWSVKYRMALLRKDVKAAEDVLVAQGRVEEAIDMYDKLHEYESALTLAKDRRLPDDAVADMSQRYFQLLLDTNQEERAAALKEKEHDYEQAMKLYLKGGLPAQAARVLKEHNLSNRSQWLDTVAAALSAAGMHDRAGEFYEEMDQLQRAMDCYVKGNAFRRAVDLARRSFPSDVVGLQEMWGDWLVSQKQVDMAINHYIEARVATKAIEAALNARQWSKAAQLVETVDAASAKPYFKKLARHYEEAKQYAQAERFFVEADVPQLAVEMYTEANMWEAAHKLASTYMSEGEVRMLYIDQAQKFEAVGKLREAEKLYMQVEEVDLAITMYKKHRKYDSMVRLVSTHREEHLKETHQFLAQQLEMEGDLKQAEHHYTESGEWLSAVNMYRSNDMWDDALRVAKYHGGQTAQKRVAYAWALALGGDAGAKMLLKQGLIETAIDYATESGAFDHAFELAGFACKSKLPDIYLKHAIFLEDEERYREAEEEFIKAAKPREAVEMYMHQKDWVAAMRVAQQHDPAAVGDIYAGQGDDLKGARDFAKAEEMYLLGSKPDKALAMYEEAGLWDNALKVCQRHLPHKLTEMQLKYQSVQAATGKGGTKADYLSSGRMWEQSKEWGKAVDAYLQAKHGVLSDPDDLEEIWESAVLVARNHVPNRYVQVVRDVSKRLCGIRKHDAAAELLREAGQLEEAVEAAMDGGAWEKAKDVAHGDKRLEALVEAAHQRHLVQGGATDELMELGQTDAALDILAQKGHWEKLWDVAAKERLPASVVHKYVALRVRKLLEEGGAASLDEAVRTLQQHGTPTGGESYPMYEDVVKRVLGRNEEDEKKKEHAATLQALRQVLYNVARDVKASGSKGSKRMPEELEHLLMATHYSKLLEECQAQGGKDCLDLAGKIAITLLRYIDIVPADKAFYKAGQIHKKLGSENLAFVMLNRYVDLTEVIEEGDVSLIDNSDFAEATNVPVVTVLPPHHYLPNEAVREEVRDWVLSVCMDAQMEQALPPFDQAKGTMYAGLYASDAPSCIVTGYPVSKRDLLEINNSRANKRDWNVYVRTFRKCPWTQKDQSPHYGSAV